MSLDKALDMMVSYFEKTAKGKVKARNRPSPVFDSTHPKVTDNKDHYPLGNENQARNAWARVNQYGGKKPSWWSGSLSELKNAVKRKIHSKYPKIEFSDEKKSSEYLEAVKKYAELKNS